MKKSLLIARYALFPGKCEGQPVCPRVDGTFVVTAESASRCLASLDRLVDARGELRMTFPDCFALVAPFLLFRLKREGFSRCRAFMKERRLVLTARR